MKEQILIRNLGLGWEDSYHPWSAVGHTYNSEELLEHLLEVVIPMSSTRDIPLEPPMNVPKMPEIKSLGTVSHLAMDQERMSEDKLESLKEKGWAEKNMCEERGEGDGWAEKQHLLPPKMSNLKGFRIEMTFENTGDDGSLCLAWYQGTIEKILNVKTNRIRVRCDEDCMGDNDARVTTHKLVVGNWNPKKLKKGGWREYITE